MEKALNEIGKLRTEMHVGFIELENQMSSTRDQMNESFRKVSESMSKVIDTTKKVAGNVERG
ncbi:MAG: hypothetical protein AAF620_20560, partial [Bacteroidota bacterium]